MPAIVLPIGISFFTFQQIGLLIDAHQGRVGALSWVDHVFFIGFFPQLIAGPIVRQDDMLPQLREKRDWRLHADQVAIGLALFALGPFKKAFLIDPLAPRIDLFFLGAQYGSPMGFLDAWTAALAYGFQIYFDFSAYSDMAIGLGFMFGFRLPINFFSPYKAVGLYLAVNHLWRRLGDVRLRGLRERVCRTPALHRAVRVASLLLTFAVIDFAWIFFRSPDFPSAFRLVAAMLGFSGWYRQPEMTPNVLPVLPIYFFVCWGLPNSIQVFARTRAALAVESYVPAGPAPVPRLAFSLSRGWAMTSALIFVTAWFALANLRPFICFQF